MSTAQFHIENAKELDRLFGEFPRVSARKGLRKAVRDAHRIVFDRVRRDIQGMSSRVENRHGPGLRARMVKALKLRARRKNPKGTYAVDAIFVDAERHGLATYGAGASSSLETRKTTGRRYFIPAALEFGHKDPAGAPVAAKPFMAPAVDASTREVEAKLNRLLADELDRLVKEFSRS